jgi:uncharacterized protein (DUF433 family)
MSSTIQFVPSAEAAFIAGLTQQQINRMADEHLVPESLLAQENGARRFARITAAFASFFFASDSLLIAAARKRILSELTARVTNSQSSEALLSLQGGMRRDIDWTFTDANAGLKLDFSRFVIKAIDRASEVDAADALIEKKDGLMGGKPCFRGTRLPVEMVTASLDKGIPEERVMDEYSLTKAQLNAARVYTQVHPRRGRPVTSGQRAQ